MVAHARKTIDQNGQMSLDRDAPFIISEDDIIAFGQFEEIGVEPEEEE